MNYFCLLLVCAISTLCVADENPGDASISTRKLKRIIPFNNYGNYYRVFSLGHIEGLINTSQQNNLALSEVDVDFTGIWTKLASEEETDDSLDPAENDDEEASMSTHHYSKCYNWKLCGNRPCTVCYKQCILVSNVNGRSRILCSNLCHGYHHCLKKRRHCANKYRQNGCGYIRRGHYYHPLNN